MKLTKIFAVLLAAVLCFSSCSCAKRKQNADDDNTVLTQTEEPTEKSDGEKNEEENKATSEKADNNENEKNEDMPKVFWCMEDGNLNITYHLEGCPLIKGKNASEVSWEMVEAIGLRKCEECNPPLYKNYKE